MAINSHSGLNHTRLMFLATFLFQIDLLEQFFLQHFFLQVTGDVNLFFN